MLALIFSCTLCWCHILPLDVRRLHLACLQFVLPSGHDRWTISSVQLWAAWLPVMWSTSRSHADKCPPLLHFENCTFACFEYPRAKLFRGSQHVCWCAATYLLNMMFYPVTAGPGPGRYGLPPTIGFVGHDYTKSTSPAYSFHGRMTDTSKCFQLLCIETHRETKISIKMHVDFDKWLKIIHMSYI